MPKITQMENDLRTLFYRLVLEDKYTHAPETLEVMERLAPKYMENMNANTQEHPMTDWNDGYILEGMDRCETIRLLLDQLLSEHPAVLKADAKEHVDKCQVELGMLYQKIGMLDKTEAIKWSYTKS